MSSSSMNREKIQKNNKELFLLEGSVNHSKANAYLTRSVVSENASLIAKNYNSAFLGNRQLANDNTEALFRNRIAIAHRLPANNEVEINYRDAMINKAKLAYLDHRSALNAQVLSISQDMAALNTMAIAINRRVMATNENIKNFNAELIALTQAELEANVDASPSVDTNALIVEENAAKIEEIKRREEDNIAAANDIFVVTNANKEAALKNAEEIANRREAIKRNFEGIQAFYASWSFLKNFDCN